jgi:hypothetical protein
VPAFYSRTGFTQTVAAARTTVNLHFLQPVPSGNRCRQGTGMRSRTDNTSKLKAQKLKPKLKSLNQPPDVKKFLFFSYGFEI